MAEQWKDFESYAAWLFGCHRCWANSGERLDFPRPDELAHAHALGQCKNTAKLSLNELTTLAEEMEAESLRNLTGKGQKLGVVCTKVRRGRGQKSSTLVVMTDAMWLWLVDNPMTLDQIRRTREEKEGQHGTD